MSSPLSVVDIPGASTVVSINPSGQFIFLTLPPGATPATNALLRPESLHALGALLKAAGAAGVVVLAHGCQLDVLSEASLNKIGLQRKTT